MWQKYVDPLKIVGDTEIRTNLLVYQNGFNFSPSQLTAEVGDIVGMILQRSSKSQYLMKV